jgi:hypothetical protein
MTTTTTVFEKLVRAWERLWVALELRPRRHSDVGIEAFVLDLRRESIVALYDVVRTASAGSGGDVRRANRLGRQCDGTSRRGELELATLHARNDRERESAEKSAGAGEDNEDGDHRKYRSA